MAGNKVFVDSNFFVALFNPADTLHKRTLKISQKIKKENPRLYISNFVFLEVVTVLAQRVNKRAAVALGEHLLKDQQLELILVDKRLNNLSWEIFKGIKKKNISFVDCSILAVVKVEGIKEILTFDKQGFQSLRGKFRFSFYG